MTDLIPNANRLRQPFLDALLILCLVGGLAAVFVVDQQDNTARVQLANVSQTSPALLVAGPRKPSAGESKPHQGALAKPHETQTTLDQFAEDQTAAATDPKPDRSKADSAAHAATSGIDSNSASRENSDTLANSSDSRSSDAANAAPRELVATLAIDKKLEYTDTIPTPLVEVLQEDEVPKVEFFKTETVAKSVVFLVDRSGSMKGRSISRTKLALLKSVLELKRGQKFYVVFFSDEFLPMLGATSFPSELSEISLSIKGDVFKWLRGVNTQGGTFPEPALQKIARDLKPDVIYFLTDGKFPRIQQQTFDLLKDAGSVVHTIGFLNPAAEGVLKDVADRTGGTYRFVGPDPLLNPVAESKSLVTEMTQQLVFSMRAPDADLQEIRQALQSFSGKDFGPRPGSTEATHELAIKRWTSWWIDEQLLPGFRDLAPQRLAEQLKHQNAIRRLVAAIVIRERKLDLIAELIDALADSDEDVVQEVRRALIAFADGLDNGPNVGASEAEKQLAVGSWKRWLETNVIVQSMMQSNPAVVIAQLRDADPQQRWAAVIVIRRRQLAAEAALVQTLNDESEYVRKDVHLTLVQLAKQDLGPRSDAEAERRRAFEAWSRWLEMRELMPLLAKVSQDGLMEALSHDNPLHRWAALNTLRDRKLEVSPSTLIQRLADPEPAVSGQAHQMLVAIADGLDFGPTDAATVEEVKEAVNKWRDWRIARDEKKARSKLMLAKKLITGGNTPAGKKWLNDIVRQFPGTPSAIAANRLLKR